MKRGEGRCPRKLRVPILSESYPSFRAQYVSSQDKALILSRLTSRVIDVDFKHRGRSLPAARATPNPAFERTRSGKPLNANVRHRMGQRCGPAFEGASSDFRLQE